MGPLKKIPAPVLWAGAGFICWGLATYPFRTAALPLAAMITRILAETTLPAAALPALAIIVSLLPLFILSFAGTLILSLLSGMTLPRATCFIIGAVTLSLFYHLRQLSGLLASNADHLFPALTWIITGITALLIIVPISAFLGGMTGKKIK